MIYDVHSSDSEVEELPSDVLDRIDNYSDDASNNSDDEITGVDVSTNSDPISENNDRKIYNARDGWVWEVGVTRTCGRVSAANVVTRAQGLTRHATNKLEDEMSAFCLMFDHSMLQKILQYTDVESKRANGDNYNLCKWMNYWHSLDYAAPEEFLWEKINPCVLFGVKPMVVRFSAKQSHVIGFMKLCDICGLIKSLIEGNE
jgi:hypothetical protein